jgi:hypothetical protein
MKVAVQSAFYLAGLWLDVAILAELLRGQGKRYPFLFLVVVADLLTTVAEAPVTLHLMLARPHSILAEIYWIDEPIMQVLLYLLVISLVYRATYHWKPRRTLLLGVVGCTLLFGGISLLVHFNVSADTAQWMTPWLRDLNFCAVILDLGLWGLLIGDRRKDYRLLMVTGALGVQFTGNAIGTALREIYHPLQGVTGYLIPCSNLACLYIWWRAFRMPDSATPPRSVSLAASGPSLERADPK